MSDMCRNLLESSSCATNADPDASACRLWQGQGCLALAAGVVGTKTEMSEHDACVAAYTLARRLRATCLRERRTADACSCPPLQTLGQMMQLLGERKARQCSADTPTFASSSEPVCLIDVVHEAACLQDVALRESLSIHLERALVVGSRRGIDA